MLEWIADADDVDDGEESSYDDGDYAYLYSRW
jgi:hypothetical protein